MAADGLRVLARDPARTLVAADFDGTLAPIVDDPERAVPLPEALEALRALIPAVGAVAIVSGRPVEFLAAALPVPGLTLVGQYGLERLVDGNVVVDVAAVPYLDAVATAADAAARAWPDLYVERKGRLAVTLHWRRSPEMAADATAWVDATATDLGLAVYPTKMARELRPPVTVDKGSAVEALAAGRSAACFAGDDRGDLAGFDALDRLVTDGRLGSAVRIGVRSVEAPPEILARADVVVDGPAGLAALLSDLVRDLSSG